MKKVNLGSGTTCLDDWTNIDNSFNARLAKHPWLRYLLLKIGILSKKYYEIPWAEHIKSTMVRDVRKKLPFDNESVDFIYSSHLMEHLRKDETEKVLKECLRVLKRGGVLRLSVPNLELVARNYIKEIEDAQNSRRKNDYLPSERFLDRLDIGAEKSIPPLLSRVFPSRHKWMYDELSLTALLECCGFVNVEKRSYKVGRVPDIDLLDNRPESSLYIEAEKP